VIRIYTDGACAPTNPGHGGFAYVAIMPDGDVVTYAEAYQKTTNNRMELMAVLRAIENFAGHKIHIHSDSTYVVNPISSGRIKNKKDAEILRQPNSDLWIKIKAIVSSDVKCSWVKGHNGNEYNEMADRLSYEIIKEQKNKKKDTGYKPKKVVDRFL